LIVGPYPPPEGGWSTAIREEREELEHRGITCRVLNLGTNRRVKSEQCLRVRNGFEFAAQLLRYGLSGYCFRLHMNGDSPKGMWIVLFASFIAILCLCKPCLSFHAGCEQAHFPHRGKPFLGVLWLLIFNSSSIVLCDSDEVRNRILPYRFNKRGVYGISPFSSRRIRYHAIPLRAEIESFLSTHRPVLFSYFAYRPEYELDTLCEALSRLRKRFPSIGLLAVDDRSYPAPDVEHRAYALLNDASLSGVVLRVGSVGRDEFLTLLGRSDLYVRTPRTDGVCSSILESLHLKVPVVAAENGSRPPGVVTYGGGSRDLEATLVRAIENLDDLKHSLQALHILAEDSVTHLVDIIESNCLR